MSKIIIIDTDRRRAAEKARRIQQSTGGQIVYRRFPRHQGRPGFNPDDTPPPRAA